jgi:molybdate transport system substrate-binding protein
MTEAMNEIGALYTKSHPDVKIVYNFDSSGTLKTQIQQGAPCDIFISAGQLQMNQLDIDADPKVNVGKLDFVLRGSRFDIVSNKVVLITPLNSTKDISDFKDLLTDKVSLAALGNADVPVGQYSKEIYTNLGLWDALEKSGKVTYGSNVKEVLAHVESGAADCGIVYGTDAATAKGVKVVAAAPANSHNPITYPAAILKGVQDQKAAEAFVAYLKGPDASKVFERIGFARP